MSTFRNAPFNEIIIAASIKQKKIFVMTIMGDYQNYNFIYFIAIKERSTTFNKLLFPPFLFFYILNIRDIIININCIYTPVSEKSKTALLSQE